MAISCIVCESDLLVENRANFIPHLYLAPPQRVTPSEFREDLDIHKTRMNGLSCGEESLTIYSAVLIQCQRMTDGRTDGQTDVQPISITCFSIADARKKSICPTSSLSVVSFTLALFYATIINLVFVILI